MDVMSWYFIPPVNTGLVHVILTIYPAERMGFPAHGSNCLLSVLLPKWNRSHSNMFCCAEQLHWHNRAIAIEVELAWQWQFNAWHNWALLLPCDVLKIDWYCQLSGSRSNSLSLWKLPGHFSYGLEMRLLTFWKKLRRFYCVDESR